MNHLQETARHYANLAEQYRTELVEQQQLNEDILGLVEALCEELGIDVDTLFDELYEGGEARMNRIRRAQMAAFKKRGAAIDASMSAPRGSKKHREAQERVAEIEAKIKERGKAADTASAREERRLERLGRKNATRATSPLGHIIKGAETSLARRQQNDPKWQSDERFDEPNRRARAQTARTNPQTGL